MTLDRREIARLAHLARLRLSAEEEEELCDDLDLILQYVCMLDDIDTERSLPPLEEQGLLCRLREDSTERTLTVDEALANAPSSENGHFTVPAVVRPGPIEGPENT